MWYPAYESCTECPLLHVDRATCNTKGSKEEGQHLSSPQLLEGWRWSWLVITGWIVSITWLMTQHHYPKVFIFRLYQLAQHACLQKNGGEVGIQFCSLCWASVMHIFHSCFAIFRVVTPSERFPLTQTLLSRVSGTPQSINTLFTSRAARNFNPVACVHTYHFYMHTCRMENHHLGWQQWGCKANTDCPVPAFSKISEVMPLHNTGNCWVEMATTRVGVISVCAAYTEA